MQELPGQGLPEDDHESATGVRTASTTFLSQAKAGDILLSSHNEDGACTYLYDWVNSMAKPEFCHAMLVTAVNGGKVSVVEAGGPGTPVSVEQDISARVAGNAHVALLRVSGLTDEQRQAAVAKGLSYVGRPYVGPNELGDSMYCSYLVYLAYMEATQTDLHDWLFPVTPDDLNQSARTTTVHDTGYCLPCAGTGWSPGQCSISSDGNTYQCDAKQCLSKVDSCPDTGTGTDTGSDIGTDTGTDTGTECYSCADNAMAPGACEDWGNNEFYLAMRFVPLLKTRHTCREVVNLCLLCGPKPGTLHAARLRHAS